MQKIRDINDEEPSPNASEEDAFDELLEQRHLKGILDGLREFERSQVRSRDKDGRWLN
jgi:hypothetical protein